MSARALYRYNFTDEKDIAANRYGKVTQTQYEAFEASAQGMVGVRGVLNIITLALFFFVLPATLLWFFRAQLGYGLRFYFAILGLLTYLIEVPFIWRFIRNQIVDWELKRSRLTQADGTIVWRRNRYMAGIKEQYLQPLYGELSVTPGEYRFYYLPASGRLLSAERTNPNIQLLRDALAQTNNFLVSALEANRKRQLAASQMLRLFGLIAASLLGVIVILVITIGLTLAAYNFLGLLEFSRWYALLILLLGLLIALGSLSQSAALLTDIIGGKVVVVEGKVAKTVQTLETRQGKHQDYYYEALYANLKFEVSAAAYEALVSDQEYYLYYTPRSKTLVAIEPK